MTLNNYQRESVEGSYLVVYINGEKFTPEVRDYQSWDDGDTYSLVETHPEAIRLAEYFGAEIIPFATLSIRVIKEERRGFFGGKRIETVYEFTCCRFRKEFQSDLVYLEK